MGFWDVKAVRISSPVGDRALDPVSVTCHPHHGRADFGKDVLVTTEHVGRPQPAARAGSVSTGTLPPRDEVQVLVEQAYERYRDVDDGAVADYIPALAHVSPDLFGICVVGTHGGVFAVGDTDSRFSMQSVSKPFVFALVCQFVGADVVRQKVGVNATGLPFNSVMAVELHAERSMNPMVNAGAIATTSLVPGATADEKWDFIRAGMSRFAGHELALNPDVYASEAATNLRNQGIAHLLDSYGKLYFDPDEATDIYTRQCSIEVTVTDLATMAATLADGGVNPLTQERVLDPENCRPVLAVLATAGLYDRTGDWLYDVGLPGKSGVSGGIVTIAPGKGGLATYSPRLDAAGNSIRGQLATRDLSDALGLNLFASSPEQPAAP
jgi:glutaminase